MRITIKLFALLGTYMPPGAKGNEGEMEVPDGATPMQVLGLLGVPPAACHLVLINGNYVAPGAWGATVLAPGDALAVWPPIAGG